MTSYLQFFSTFIDHPSYYLTLPSHDINFSSEKPSPFPFRPLIIAVCHCWSNEPAHSYKRSPNYREAALKRPIYYASKNVHFGDEYRRSVRRAEMVAIETEARERSRSMLTSFLLHCCWATKSFVVSLFCEGE